MRQIVTVRFNIPLEWDANSFADNLGECFAEANSDDANLVALLDVTSNRCMVAPRQGAK